MKHYTDTISKDLAEKLKKKGMPIRYEQTDEGVRAATTFGTCLDWLMLEKQLFVIVEPYWDFASEFITDLFEASVVRQGSIHAPTPTIISTTWHEAAETAIEKALTLI